MQYNADVRSQGSLQSITFVAREYKQNNNTSKNNYL